MATAEQFEHRFVGPSPPTVKYAYNFTAHYTQWEENGDTVVKDNRVFVHSNRPLPEPALGESRWEQPYEMETSFSDLRPALRAALKLASRGEYCRSAAMENRGVNEMYKERRCEVYVFFQPSRVDVGGGYQGAVLGHDDLWMAPLGECAQAGYPSLLEKWLDALPSNDKPTYRLATVSHAGGEEVAAAAEGTGR